MNIDLIVIRTENPELLIKQNRTFWLSVNLKFHRF